MGPEILIVGDRSHRGALIPRVQDLGYTVTPVRERELAGRVAASPAPAAVLICLGDADAAALVDAARRGRDDVPVVLFGNLGGALRDLADVLELGADHFLAAPVEDAELAHVLTELAGPGAPEDEAGLAWPGDEDDSVRPLTDGAADRDPVLGQLHRTLEILAARLASHESADSEPDALDLESLGLDSLPDVDGELRPEPGALLIDPESSDPAAPRRPEPTQRLAAPRTRLDHEDSRGAMQGDDTMRLAGLARPAAEGPVREDRWAEPVREDRSSGPARTDRLRPEPRARPAPRPRPEPGDTTARILAPRAAGDSTARVAARPDTSDGADSTARLTGRPDVVGGEPPASVRTGEPRARREVSERVAAPLRRDARDRSDHSRSGDEEDDRTDETHRRGNASERTGALPVPRLDTSERTSETRARGSASEAEGSRWPRGASETQESGRARGPASEAEGSRWPRDTSETQDSGRARGSASEAEGSRWPRSASEPRRPRAAPQSVDMRRSEPLVGLEIVGRLWQLHARQVQGRLCVGFADGTILRQVWWRRGEPVYAASTAATDGLLARLQARGLLARSQVAAAARVVDDDLAGSARRLVHAGLLKPREQQEAVRDAVRRICESLCSETAERWSLDAEPAPAEVALATPMLALLAAGARLGLGLDRLRAQLPGSMSLRLAVDDPAALAAELRWPGVEDWLLLLDGTRSLAQLVAEDGLDERDLWALGCVLAAAGLATPVEPDADAALVELDRRRIDERLALARDSDYLALLGVGRDASRAEVLRAHADLRGTFADERLEPRTREELADALAELHAALDEACEVLLDEVLRAAYLAQLSSRPSGPESSSQSSESQPSGPESSDPESEPS